MRAPNSESKKHATKSWLASRGYLHDLKATRSTLPGGC